MTSDEKLAAARRQLAEAESVLLQALASARSLLAAIEEENRELRREAILSRPEFYTEEQFAALLQVSAATVARRRRAGRLPYLTVGTQIRYSSVHLTQLAVEQSTAKAPEAARGRRGLRSVGSGC